MKRVIKIILVILTIVVVIAAIGVFIGYKYIMPPYEGVPKRVYVHSDDTPETLKKMLVDSLGADFGRKAFLTWNLQRANIGRAYGSYLVKPGETALQLSRRMRGGAQDPVKVVVSNRRTLAESIERIADSFEFSPAELGSAFNKLLDSQGVPQAERISYLLPDSYEFYWTTAPDKVAQRLVDQRNKFWNTERLDKATALKLTPEEITTVASIVEEETAKTDERPTVARLYLNRLAKGMRLQADPTVKFAVGDPTLKRILNTHLATVSPYNTYLVDGLPPGPIRMVDKSTIDAVLNAPKHDYIYMCAKEDFSGYHNFAKTLSEHNANANRYHQALNKLKIK